MFTCEGSSPFGGTHRKGGHMGSGGDVGTKRHIIFSNHMDTQEDSKYGTRQLDEKNISLVVKTH